MHESLPETFHCEVEPRRGWIRVRPHGELDLATAGQLESSLNELRESGFDQLELDLSALSFIDSTGLRLVLRWDAEARRDGMELRLVPGAPAVQRVFEVSGLLGQLPFQSG